MKYTLAPFSNMPSKLWNFDNYAEIIKILYKNYNLSPIIYCSAKEHKFAVENNVFKGLPVDYVSGVNDFKFIFENISKSLFYVGNDTGIMHVASYFNLPIFSLFSSRDLPGKWEPDSERVKIYRNRVECEGCLLSICPINNLCMEKTPVPVVLNDIIAFLDSLDFK